MRSLLSYKDLLRNRVRHRDPYVLIAQHTASKCAVGEKTTKVYSLLP